MKKSVNDVSCAWTGGVHIISVQVRLHYYQKFATCVLASLSNFLPVCTFFLCHCSYVGELEEKTRIVECLF